MNKIKPYVYKITHKITGEYYFGAKYSKYTSFPEKFWQTYFTSSSYVKEIIDVYGKDIFIPEILFVFDDEDFSAAVKKALIKERELIEKHISDQQCLNMGMWPCNPDRNKKRRWVNPKTGESSYTISAKKGAQTRKNTICENGKSIEENSIIKTKETYKANPQIMQNRKVALKKTMSTPDENGLTGYQKIGMKIRGDKNGSSRPEIKKKISDGVKKWAKENPDKVKENTEKMTLARAKIKEDGLTANQKHSIFMTENNPASDTIWINNGLINIRHPKNEDMPEGFTLGMIKFKHKKEKPIRRCPWCGKEGKGGNMTKYHFDNCKLKEKE